MMDECFPEKLHNDSDADYDFIYDGPVAGEYDSLFSPQQSTTEYAEAIQLSTTQPRQKPSATLTVITWKPTNTS
jgi:hypothetical protein